MDDNYLKEILSLAASEESEEFYLRVLRKSNKYVSLLVNIENAQDISNFFGFDVVEKLLYDMYISLNTLMDKKEYVARLKRNAAFIMFIRNDGNTDISRRINDILNMVKKFKIYKGVTKFRYDIKIEYGYYYIKQNEYDLLSIIRKTVINMLEYTYNISHDYSALEIELFEDIEDAFQKHQFVPYFQTRHNILTGDVVGTEVVARWLHPTYGVLRPAMFFPLLERVGRVHDLDLYTIEEGCKLLRNWIDKKVMPVVLTIDISYSIIYIESFLQNTFKIIDKYKIPASFIQFNFGFFSLPTIDDIFISTIKQLKDRGFHTSISNFANNYFSVDMFNNYFDSLTIDCNKFLPENSNDAKQLKLLDVVSKASKSANMVLVASNVSNEEQAAALNSIGCTIIQGKLFGEALPLDKFEEAMF